MPKYLSLKFIYISWLAFRISELFTLMSVNEFHFFFFFSLSFSLPSILLVKTIFLIIVIISTVFFPEQCAHTHTIHKFNSTCVISSGTRNSTWGINKQLTQNWKCFHFFFFLEHHVLQPKRNRSPRENEKKNVKIMSKIIYLPSSRSCFLPNLVVHIYTHIKYKRMNWPWPKYLWSNLIKAIFSLFQRNFFYFFLDFVKFYPIYDHAIKELKYEGIACSHKLKFNFTWFFVFIILFCFRACVGVKVFH